MPDAFRDVIAALWRALGLSRPGFEADDVAALQLEGVRITLALSADGRHILLSAKAGALSANVLVRDQQVSRLLKTNLHTLSSSRVCACLDESDPQTPSIVVRAALPCEVKFVDPLAEAIADAGHLAKQHARELGGDAGAQPAAAAGTPLEGLSDDTLVFRL